MRASANAGAAEHARQRRDLLDVGGRRSGARARDRAVDVVKICVAGDVARDPAPASPRWRATALRPWPGQLARREVVAAHGVERVDQLAARARRSARGASDRPSASPHAAPRAARCAARAARRARARAARRASARAGRGRAGRSRAGCGSRSRPGSAARTRATSAADQLRLGRVAVVRRLEHLGRARRDRASTTRKIRSRSASSPVVSRSNWRRCSSIERQIAEVGAPGRDEVLLLGRQREHACGAELAATHRDGAAVPSRRDAPPGARPRACGRRERSRG